MHEYAERGLAASFHYHEQKIGKGYAAGKSSSLPRHLQWIAEVQEVTTRLKNNEEVPMEQLKLDLFAKHIFVYSPKGDIYDLPEGSFPLDFAYRIHSDIGKHAHGFKVNGKIASFDKQLQNGDVVEVMTRRTGLPRKAWLNWIKTGHARNKIRAQLKKMVDKN
jgi:GTP pyrophosphokinase